MDQSTVRDTYGVKQEDQKRKSCLEFYSDDYHLTLLSEDLKLDGWGRPKFDEFPSLQFDDLWSAINIRKRCILFEEIFNYDHTTQTATDVSLGRLDHNDSEILVDMLKFCSLPQFTTYIQVCAVDRGSPIAARPLVPELDRTYSWDPSQEWIEQNYWKHHGVSRLARPHIWALRSFKKFYSRVTNLFRSAWANINQFFLALKQTMADRALRRKVHSVPPEVFSMVQKSLLHSTFGPRRVSPENEKCKNNVSLALNRNLYTHYRAIFWSENTWVVGEGDWETTLEFLREIPDSAFKLIRKVEMRLSVHDYDHESLDRYFASPEGKEQADGMNSLQILSSFTEGCRDISWRVKDIWHWKLYHITSLDLEYFEFDCRDAYAPDGEYLALDALRNVPPFRNGWPEHFEILAPNQNLADQLWDIFVQINT